VEGATSLIDVTPHLIDGAEARQQGDGLRPHAVKRAARRPHRRPIAESRGTHLSRDSASRTSLNFLGSLAILQPTAASAAATSCPIGFAAPLGVRQ